MITTNDIRSVFVSGTCHQGSPCEHRSLVLLNDDRRAFGLDSFQIWAIIAGLGSEKINPGGGWDADLVKQHFKIYSKPYRDWTIESAETVLNTLFLKKNSQS